MATEINELNVDAPVSASTVNKLLAEAWGTFILVFSVIGAALFATINQIQPNGAGFIGVAFALGLGVLIAAYTVGSVSGGHFNPAVTIGLAVAGRASWKDVPGYIVAQIIGGAVASSLLFIIAANGQPGLLDYLVQGGDGYVGVFSPAVAKVRDLLVDVFVDAVKNAKTITVPAADGRIKKVN